MSKVQGDVEPCISIPITIGGGFNEFCLGVRRAWMVRRYWKKIENAPNGFYLTEAKKYVKTTVTLKKH